MWQLIVSVVCSVILAVLVLEEWPGRTSNRMMIKMKKK